MSDELKSRRVLFTEETLRNLLSDQVLTDGNSLLPALGDSGLKNLVSKLNRLDHHISHSLSTWAQDRERVAEIDSAINILLNGLRLHYPNPPTPEETPEYEVIEQLYQALRRFHELGLPFSLEPDRGEIDSWKQYARLVERAFHDHLPNRSKKAGYRFIAAVAAHLTQETPTVVAVESHLKKGRTVNRGKDEL